MTTLTQQIIITIISSSSIGYIIYYILNQKKVKAEGDIKTADYVDKLLEIGRKQLEDVSKEFDFFKQSNIENMKINGELMRQNTIIIYKNKILMEENIELRKSISELKNRVNELEKREVTLVSENKILSKQVGELINKLKNYEGGVK